MHLRVSRTQVSVYLQWLDTTEVVAFTTRIYGMCRYARVANTYEEEEEKEEEAFVAAQRARRSKWARAN